MKLTIQLQEKYSRGELLLRTFFGWIYIFLPHAFLLMFVGLWGAILQFAAFWIILFTGRYPQSMFEFQVGLLRWSLRVSARTYNLSDGYPAFGIKSGDEYTSLEVPYPEKVSRGLTLVRALFGWLYVGIPHFFILYFRTLFVGLLVFIAWWVVLFTGEYPEFAHEWAVGHIRWQTRLNLYLGFMTDEYPPFTGDELADEKAIAEA